TSDFMMVMECAYYGSLRHRLDKDFIFLHWLNKFEIIENIARGLDYMHKNGLIHKDLHCGNILNSFHEVELNGYAVITDLGLCRPANEKSEKHNENIYGVLPYMAPEVLRGKKYTQESDIYSFGIIIFETFNGFPPYHN
ncbi:kinase-like domain-containing protein, partial [Glomus cerebriforme]